jgi:DNA-binding MarR family transcriptional regulator
VAAFEQLTRALVGVTLESLEVLGGAVSVPQFRLLMTLDDLGRVPSSVLAGALEMAASSVTRLVDKLQPAGFVARGSHDSSRSIVTLEVTDAGRDLVTTVLDRRHELLEAVLDRMDPEEREWAGAVARDFARLAGPAAVAVGASGPVPL